VTPPIAPEHFNDIVAAVADLAIVLDCSGKVQSVVVNPLNPTLGRLDHWKDRDIREFMAVDSLNKLERQLEAYRAGEKDVVETIEVNHYDNANWVFPIRYTLHRTGQEGIILMLGRDLRPIAKLQHRLVKAQLALEKDYDTHRDYETRYRVIMEAVRDALVLVEVATGRILDINTSAAQILGPDPDTLIGTAFTQEFGGRRGELLESLLSSAADDTAGAIPAETKRRHKKVMIDPTVFRAAGDKTLLCRIEATTNAGGVAAELGQSLAVLYRDGADAVVFTDASGTIRTCNERFLSLCDAGQIAVVKGKSLSDFLARGSVDLKVMLDNTARTGRMRVHATRLEGAHGAQLSVEISATHLPGTGGFGFVIRDTSRMDVVRDSVTAVPAGGPVTDEAMRSMMNLVGAAPLRDIVSAANDVIEKICIETAVEMADNNRVAVADMLGLSRQSLYVKLRKYGMLAKNDG